MKYLVELYENDYESKKINTFYFDTLEELQDWINKEIEDKTLFNYGFTTKKIVLTKIGKGSEE